MRELHRDDWVVGARAQVLTDGTAHVDRADVQVRRDSSVVLGDGATLDGAVLDVGPEARLVIGPRCRIRRCRIIVRGGSTVALGPDTTWESGSIMATMGQSVQIGADCMLARGVRIRTADGHGIFDRSGQRLNEDQSVTVADHVWLGNSVRVSKGCSIGDGAVVGQMSLATGELEAYGLYVGVPARRIRTGVAWSRTFDYEDVPPRYRPDAG